MTTPEPLVTVDGVSRTFHDRRRGEVRAVDSVSLTLARGEFVALRGPTGCGKSSLLRVIAALDRATSGDVTFGGRSYATSSSAELTVIRRRIGLVFQTPVLLPRVSVWENVALPLVALGVRRAERRRAAEAALEPVGVAALADANPASLSGGERQRVGIARALVVRPDLVIADEPTAHLDREASERVRDALAALTERAAVITATHDDHLASGADRHLTMRAGRLQPAP